MRDPGLPDDWSRYATRCSRCGGRNHASGTETCGCDEEYQDLCADLSAAEAELARFQEDDESPEFEAAVEAVETLRGKMVEFER